MPDETTTIKCKQVSLEEGGDAGYKKVISSDGKTYSAWPTTKVGDETKPSIGYDLITAGAVLDITIRTKGNYKNIVKTKTHEGPFNEPKGGNGGDDRAESIEAQVAAYCTKDILVALSVKTTPITPDQVETWVIAFRKAMRKPLSAKAEALPTGGKTELDEIFPVETSSIELTTDRYFEIAKFLGFDTPPKRNKALGVKAADWTKGMEAALDKMLETAHLEGHHQEFQSWRQVG